MSEEIKSTIKYLKNKNNTRRIKVLTINEAQKVVEEIERLNNIINKLEKLLNELKVDTENDIKYARSKNDNEEIIRLNREFNMTDMILIKLRELKGVDKE